MIVPLNALRPGERGIVVNVLGGPAVRQRLVAMGLTPGAPVQIIEAHSYGPIIISVGGVRFAIGRGMAGKVMIRKL
ncbi:iron(II) transport system protein A [Thermococcus cleftensis]|uniref:Iron(II) transport system protein A n=1 Tax=Thermococcus cleftensis (strain DSM 27260 / KACC 17922 / CL1) TaxID=163003 RepID=I3ZRI7_THECF|nr:MULTISPECIES: FeoA domain-containing protein [Thermococcus]AFL94321.1 iron(II) transport system protein A [Thermococcus cleftensis]NJE03330.1 ferrous iron transport protein A [Thermococcus sp. MV11]